MLINATQNMKIHLFTILMYGLLSVGIVPSTAQTSSGIHFIKKMVIGGEGGWDYLHVDGQNRRLYLSHGTQVEVLQVDSLKKSGIIPNTPGVHGIITVP